MSYTPTQFYDRKFWDKHARKDDRPSIPSLDFAARILSGELLKGIKQTVIPQPVKPSKPTSAKPAREILKAIKAGQRLLSRGGKWFLLRLGKKGNEIHKHIKAKWVHILMNAQCLWGAVLLNPTPYDAECVLPTNEAKQQALKKAQARESLLLAAKSLAKGMA